MSKDRRVLTMVEYTLYQKDKMDSDSILENAIAFGFCCEYVNFLRTPLELSMFAPTDSEGNVLVEPKDYDKWINRCLLNVNHIEYKAYQEALERCWFEGWEYVDNNTVKKTDCPYKSILSLNDNLTIETILNSRELLLTKSKFKELVR